MFIFNETFKLIYSLIFLVVSFACPLHVRRFEEDEEEGLKGDDLRGGLRGSDLHGY